MTRRLAGPGPFVFLHVGDLHVTKAFPERSGAGGSVRPDPVLARRARRTESDLRAILGDIVDGRARDVARFVYLPGDLAENGLASEYNAILIRFARCTEPIRLIPGDHDRALGTMRAFSVFRDAMVARHGLPASEGSRAAGPIDGPVMSNPLAPRPRRVDQFYFHDDHDAIRCIFLDVVSAGRGRKGWGLDFRLGSRQIGWFADRLAEWRGRGKSVLVFMHCYPADLHEASEAAEVAGLIWAEGVRLVEMGHTHYNELGHDGRTAYATVRSVGQNEDGPAGYAVVALDRGEVSWRFRQIQQSWPFVMITSPADRRLATRPLALKRGGLVSLRALVLDRDGSSTCRCRVDGGEWRPMDRDPTRPAFVQANIAWPPGSRRLEVEAKAAAYPGWGEDLVDRDVIEPPPSDPALVPPAARPDRLGSDAYAIAPWPEKGLRGDRLGPNRFGRKW